MAPPALMIVAPSVHVPPAETVGAAVDEAETPRQSFAGDPTHGRFFACSSF
jgi:hypothetical protein